nr:Rab family GTPase [Candidatus Njordarchaeum guaymaensis]
MRARKIFKVIVVGEGNVGKTSLVRRYVDRVYVQDVIPTIGVDLTTKIIPGYDVEKQLQIWDLGGQPHLRSVAELFFRGASGMIAVFDVTRKESLIQLNGWIERVRRVTGRIPLVIVGNKIDLRPSADQNAVCITREEGIHFAYKYDSPYIEASAISGVGIEQAFISLASMLGV